MGENSCLDRCCAKYWQVGRWEEELGGQQVGFGGTVGDRLGAHNGPSARFVTFCIH